MHSFGSPPAIDHFPYAFACTSSYASACPGDRHRANYILAERIKGIEKGQVLPAPKDAAAEAVLVITEGDVKHFGAAGEARQARYLAIEREKPHNGATCEYTGMTKTFVYNDVDVIVYDARTGKKLASTHFAMNDWDECPPFASASSSFEYRVPFSRTEAWVKANLAKGWH